ncbi:hypothetical protein IM538_02885 [Cytobacillus suaedae]|nr:hypothetical protein IM538_02885 [Cytobacillus suaedae]
MQLLKFELYKIAIQKSIYIAFVLLIGATLIEQTLPNGAMNSIIFVNPLLTGMMLLIGLSTIFTKEYSSGVDNYILSSKKGRWELVGAKIGASLIYTLVVIFTWEVFNLTYNHLKFGTTGWGEPIQSIPRYAGSPYHFSMIEFHVVQMGVHVLGALCFSLVIILISSISKNALIAFVLNLLILAGPSLEFMDEIPIPWIVAALPFAFFNLLMVQPFFVEATTVSIFGVSLLSPIFACLLMVVLGGIFIVLIYQIMKKKEITA